MNYYNPKMVTKRTMACMVLHQLDTFGSLAIAASDSTEASVERPVRGKSSDGLQMVKESVGSIWAVSSP